ncbi:WYL domain-containing protein [Fusobacterium necrophorum]|uniref:WYL domain-containing protein n=1 Tax=Fusobacterium necrophorum TaxID=859 RepID=UPI00048959E3|nr:WYL domain-containing protein [Fusobacterium necrophorum]
MKKVKFTLVYAFKEVLLEDKAYFRLEIGAIGNRVFEYYSNKEIEVMDDKGTGKEYIQFNLNKKNEEMYYKVLQEHGIQTEAEYMRNIIFTYVNHPRYQREKILFFEYFELIEKAMKEKKKINIKYHGEIRTVNPYFVKVADEENRSYLFCYCEKNQDYRCYRISEMEMLMISKQNLEVLDRKYIQKIEQNFDPFHSYGKEIRVKFTALGDVLWEKAIHNRPKILRKEGEECVLECDERLAQIYFPQFLAEVEILEPKSLRKWFEEQYEKAWKQYQNMK